MSYNIIYDDESGDKPSEWNNIKVNRLSCEELFVDGLQYYYGAGPTLTLINSITQATVPTSDPITTHIQRLGNTVIVRIPFFRITAGTIGLPSPMDYVGWDTTGLVPVRAQNAIYPFSPVIGFVTQSIDFYKLTIEPIINNGNIRLRKGGASENFDDTLDLDFESIVITYMLV
jgi:hypothetical protein